MPIGCLVLHGGCVDNSFQAVEDNVSAITAVWQ